MFWPKERRETTLLERVRRRVESTMFARPLAKSPGLADAEWEDVRQGWARQASDTAVKGWNVSAIASAYRRKWPSFLRAIEGPGPLGVAHEVPEGMDVSREGRGAHHTLMTYGYALALASRHKDRLSILDWGRGPGHYYLLSQALLPGVQLDYHCQDVPTLSVGGREILPAVKFCSDLSLLERQDHFVLVSASLQYAEDWRQAFGELAKAAQDYLFITRLPVAREAKSFVVLQRPYRYGYETDWDLGWVIGRDELLAESTRLGMELIREFILDDLLFAPGAPENPSEHRGYLFRPTTAG